MAGGADIMMFQPGQPCCGGCVNWEVHQGAYRYELVSKTQSDRELYFFPADGLGTSFTTITHATAFGAQRYYSIRGLLSNFGSLGAAVAWSRDAIDQDVSGDVMDRTAVWTYVHVQPSTNKNQSFTGRSIDVNEQDNILLWINTENNVGTIDFTHLWRSDMDGVGASLIGSFPVPAGTTSPPVWYPIKLHMNHETGKTYLYEQCGAYLFPDDNRWVEYDLGSEYVGAPTYFQQSVVSLGTSLDRAHNQIYLKHDPLNGSAYNLYRIDLATKVLVKLISAVTIPYTKRGAAAAWSVKLGKVMVSTYGAAGVPPPDAYKCGFFLVPYDDTGVEWATPYEDMQVIWTEMLSREFTLGRCYESFGTAGKQTTNCNA